MKRNYSWRDQRFNGLADDLSEVVLTIGTDRFTYADVGGKLRTRKMKSVMILNKTLAQFLPENIMELADRLDLNMLMGCDGVGMSTLYVWLNVLTYKKISVDDWLQNKLTGRTMYEKSRKNKKLARKKSRKRSLRR
ncbi:MAG: hypothetical protein ACYCZW_00165 [Minisyncoccota bacterium]